MSLEADQKLVCTHYSAPFLESPGFMIIGVSKDIGSKIWPIHGLRHPAVGDTTGWYIWTGEYSEDADFFAPMHINHLNKICPEVIKYLGLAPGWRFLIAHEYEDVWEDKSLLDITL